MGQYLNGHLINEDIQISNKQMTYAQHFLAFKNYKLALAGVAQ